MTSQCKGTTKKGLPCKNRPLAGKEYCRDHIVEYTVEGKIVVNENPKENEEIRRKTGNILSILVGGIGFIASLIQIYDFLSKNPELNNAVIFGLSKLYENISVLILFIFLITVPILDYLGLYKWRAAHAVAGLGIVIGISFSLITHQTPIIESLLSTVIGFAPYLGNISRKDNIDLIDVEFMGLIGAFLGFKGVLVVCVGLMVLGLYSAIILLLLWIKTGSISNAPRLFSTPTMAIVTLAFVLRSFYY